MKLIDKTKRWDFGKTLEGRKKNYKVTLYYVEHPSYWYFMLHKDKYAYNSLWNNLKFESQDQCSEAAEAKIDEILKSGD